jgi:hypothetical protein
MGEPVGERAVVRQDEDTGRVAIEAPDRHDRMSPPTRSTTVGPLPFGSRAVVIVPRGLLSRTWRRACFPTSRPSTRTTLDPPTNVLSARRAVDCHPAGLDQVVGSATRREPARAR